MLPYHQPVMDEAAPGVLVLIVAFLAALPLIVVVAGRLRLPYTVVLVVVGLVAAALPIHDSLQLSPGLAVTVLLPGLVFEAAYRLDGDAITAPYSAQSAGPGPWWLYRFRIRTAFGVGLRPPHGASRWDF